MAKGGDTTHPSYDNTLHEAQRIAFAPIAFQSTVALVRLGILQALSDAGDGGITVAQLAQQLDLSEYGIKVLLDMGVSCRLAWLRDEHYYVLDKVGYFLLTDTMTQVNLNFTQDVCYQGLFYLMDAIREGKPAGLKVFGDWPTIYPGLGQLPEPAMQSWFEFEHHYSDKAFLAALPLVFADQPRHLIDVGGNTGKWTLDCVNYDEDVRITVMDLPEQLAMMRQHVREAGFDHRIEGLAANLLEESNPFPEQVEFG